MMFLTVKKERVEFEKIPTPSTFGCWQLDFRTEVYRGSCHPSVAMSWIRAIEAAKTFDDLKNVSIAGYQFSNFETLYAKVATAMKKILTLTHFKRKVFSEEQKAPEAGRFHRGRHIAHMIYEYIRFTNTSESVFWNSLILRAVLSEETMFKDLIRIGTKCFYL